MRPVPSEVASADTENNRLALGIRIRFLCSAGIKLPKVACDPVLRSEEASPN
jgi:hypothetical protein